jgi:hypothetical protein
VVWYYLARRTNSAAAATASRAALRGFFVSFFRPALDKVDGLAAAVDGWLNGGRREPGSAARANGLPAAFEGLTPESRARCQAVEGHIAKWAAAEVIPHHGTFSNTIQPPYSSTKG